MRSTRGRYPGCYAVTRRDRITSKKTGEKRIMTALTSNHYLIVSELPDDSVVTFHNASWDDYEDLLKQGGEATWLRISYDDGTLQAMTLSSEHERYARFFEQLMTVLKLRKRIPILSFGSTTMRKQKKRKGIEPDASFYVQSAARMGNRMELDLATDPPPDIGVEVDIHHHSIDKLPIYAGLGIGEVWRYDGDRVRIHILEDDVYRESESSLELPILTAAILTEFLVGLRRDGELETLIAFEEWLRSVA